MSEGRPTEDFGSGDTGEELPMFPLGSVLLPGMALPLRVFEPRYRQMMATVLDMEVPRFGVVLIERGSEVGGGDTRTDVGCLALVHSVQQFDDGQLAVLAVGHQRLSVERWLPDDPHPRAVVRAWPDPTVPSDQGERILSLTDEVTEVAGLAARLTGRQLPEVELDDDPVRRLYQLATLAPLGPLDRLRVLRAPDLTERVGVLSDLVHEQRVLLEARLRFGQL